MQMQLRVVGVEVSSSFRSEVLARVERQLQRFMHEIESVVIRIEDLNGPKGGVDKRCRVTLRGKGFTSLTLEDRSQSARAALDLALDRLVYTLRRTIDRQRGQRVVVGQANTPTLTAAT